MEKFFILEGGYLVLSLVVFAITIFVGTRPFVSKGALKKALIGVSVVISFLIGSHYAITTSRMNEVKTAFQNNMPILCESRMTTKVAQFVTIQKSNEWTLEGENFSSPNYSREFFSARCIVK
jgi:hypothetical protein